MISEAGVDLIEQGKAAVSGFHDLPSLGALVDQGAVVLKARYQPGVVPGMRSNALDLTGADGEVQLFPDAAT